MLAGTSTSPSASDALTTRRISTVGVDLVAGVLERLDPPDPLVEAIKVLPEREQYVMSMYYEHDMNLKEIAAVLKVTESRVCQLHSQSIARLRVKLRDY